LYATEAVVGVQTGTEIDLSGQAQSLCAEVTNRRTDVDLLLGKVDRIFAIESKRAQVNVIL
jgi:hypothetical protein